jgi:hypothetical protein
MVPPGVENPLAGRVRGNEAMLDPIFVIREGNLCRVHFGIVSSKVRSMSLIDSSQ